MPRLKFDLRGSFNHLIIKKLKNLFFFRFEIVLIFEIVFEVVFIFEVIIISKVVIFIFKGLFISELY